MPSAGKTCIMCQARVSMQPEPNTGKTCDQYQTRAGRKHKTCTAAKRGKTCHRLQAGGKSRASQVMIDFGLAFDWLS